MHESKLNQSKIHTICYNILQQKCVEMIQFPIRHEHKIQSLQSNKNENFNSSFLSEHKKKRTTTNPDRILKSIPTETRIETKSSIQDTILPNRLSCPIYIYVLLCFTIHIIGSYRLWKMKIFGFTVKSKEFDSKILNFY